MPKPWEHDPDDPLQVRPAAVWWRALTIGGPFFLFVAALFYGLFKQAGLVP